MHPLVALLAFVSIPAAEWLLARSLASDPAWSRLGTRAVRLAQVTVRGFALLLVGARVPGIGGLTERIFLASALLWMAALAFGLRGSHAGRRSVQEPASDG